MLYVNSEYVVLHDYVSIEVHHLQVGIFDENAQIFIVLELYQVMLKTCPSLQNQQGGKSSIIQPLWV